MVTEAELHSPTDAADDGAGDGAALPDFSAMTKVCRSPCDIFTTGGKMS